MASRYVNDIEISKAQRDFELKKAAFDQEVQTKKAMSEMAYSLQVNCHLALIFRQQYGVLPYVMTCVRRRSSITK